MKVGNFEARFDQAGGGIRCRIDVTDGDMPITPEVWHSIEVWLKPGLPNTMNVWLDGVACHVGDANDG